MRSTAPVAMANFDVKPKTLPPPGAGDTSMRPPISSTSRLQIARPSPVPPYLRAVERSACWNTLNSRSACSGVTPMPVSRTENASSTWSSLRETTRAPITTSPTDVNLIALPTRLLSTCVSRNASPTRRGGMSRSISNSRSSPASSTLAENRLPTFSIVSSGLNSSASSATLPASILE